jgi:ferredoxin
VKVKFVPQNLEYDIEPGQTILDLARQKNVFIKSICNGLPNCAECRVRVIEGEENVLPPSAKELGLIGTGHFIDQRRLSCQLQCFGDVTIDLTEQNEKQNQGPRRPQGSQKAEIEVSHAVSGNLLDQEKGLATLVAEAGAAQENQPQQRHNNQKQGQRQGGGGHGQNQNQNRNQNRNQNQQGRHQGNRSQQGPNNRDNRGGGRRGRP